ncbi:MAG: 23S rRNA (pseudouridine(1915)-N(3))-methyltransferase RlmH [Porticoccaceae bacterium]|jgi:23S rRNA (pseudouridine1915-N3)-methyltransferase|nr:23S rRNA (pseudouridine(1915)-N(3))-methyltransferase RlmH [Porticoccaceae bacterium]MBT5578470.1 23S rRNA (pseudouridine(1915)-N(3))-methyltransferase RlmH [Porticoccaceae bacterium]MBT7374852.1 23S rRNA (pseudouridine(1915)-N(3))-methyltransferase RlmH [Porticoccaceae bacterium]
MKLRLLAVGTKMPAWVETGCHEYGKRMPPELRIQTVEIPLGPRGKSQSSAAAIQAESKGLIKAIGDNDFVVALDVLGKTMTTEKLASNLSNWQMQGRDISLLIGGPDGLSSDCLARANLRWSLSDLTLPHPLVRIILMEQLYRAWTINSNHPYHRA